MSPEDPGTGLGRSIEARNDPLIEEPPVVSPSRSILKDLLKGTALYTVALFVQRLASIILLPINTRYLSPADYGVLELLEQVATVVSVLMGAHIAGSLGFFYFEKKAERHREAVVSTTFLGATLVGSVAAIVGLLFAKQIGILVFGTDDYRQYLTLAFLAFPVSFMLEAALSWLRVINKPTVFALASALRVTVTIVATILLVAVFQLRVLGVLISNLAAAGLLSVALMVYCFQRTRITFDVRLFGRMARFAVPLALGTMGMFVIHFGDRFILPHYRPLSELGIYGIGYKIGMLISFLSGAFHSYWTAQVFDIVRREDGPKIIARVFTYMMAFLLFFALGLIVFSRPALRILTTPGFQGAADIVPLIVAAYLLRSIAEFFRSLFLAAGRPSFDALCTWAGAAVCLGSYFLLIPRYGIWGAAGATNLAFLVIAVMSMTWTYRLIPYRLENARLAKLAITGGLLVATYLLLPVQNLLLQIGLAIALTLAFPAILFAIRFPGAGEIEHGRRLARSMLAKIVSR